MVTGLASRHLFQEFGELNGYFYGEQKFLTAKSPTFLFAVQAYFPALGVLMGTES